MPKDDLTLIACVLDRSGSMQQIINDAVGGFNAFLQSQQKDTNGECRMTLAMFNTKYELKYNNVPISEVEEFTPTSYAPMDGTALFDAVGKTINAIGKELDSLPEEEKPGKVIFVILTDGEENSSEEFSFQSIQTMIKEQREKWNWEFIFLAADERSFECGMRLGTVNNTRYNVNDSRAVYCAASAAISAARSGEKLKMPKDIT